MANATPEAARRGFDLYRQGASLVRINAILLAQGHPPVSQRMHDHYGRLVRHGYDRYVPVNELDVTVKALRLGRAS